MDGRRGGIEGSFCPGPRLIWLRVRYGISWPIVPTALAKYLGGQDRNGAQRAMAAMLQMVKLDIEGLERA